MAIVLEAHYAKKLGLPNFSSHQYAVTIRTELTAHAIAHNVESASERRALRGAPGAQVESPSTDS